MSQSVSQWLRMLTESLREAAGEENAQQARLLLCHVLSCDTGALPMYREQLLTQVQEEALRELLARRQSREPLQYLLGEWGFMGLTFLVRPGVLIPRPETELLCEEALRRIRQNGYRTVLDVCCGTGCIGISLAKLAHVDVTLSDYSPDCIMLARQNAVRNGVEVQMLQGSYFAPIAGRYDLIVCNPPYLTAADMRALQPEVAYEPALALAGGEDGLDAYRHIRQGYAAHIAPGGALLLEVGAGQAAQVAAMFDGHCEICSDLNGIERVVCITR